jgi:hypothetical protein
MPAILAAQWLPRERIHPSGQISRRPVATVANRAALADKKDMSETCEMTMQESHATFVLVGGLLGRSAQPDLALHDLRSHVHGDPAARATEHVGEPP